MMVNSAPRIAPPGGAPVSSDALGDGFTTPPLQILPPPGVFDAQASDNAVLRFRSRAGVEVLDARLHLAGGEHTANLASGAVITSGQALVDLGGLRPISRINF